MIRRIAPPRTREDALYFSVDRLRAMHTYASAALLDSDRLDRAERLVGGGLATGVPQHFEEVRAPADRQRPDVAVLEIPAGLPDLRLGLLVAVVHLHVDAADTPA